MINQARRYQRNPVITLLDLKNAFGELDHNLITSLLHYHYVPDHIRPLIGFFYTNYTIPVGTNDFVTNPINVEKSVLQGNSLSSLIFNMCFNTLIRTIENEKIKFMGHSYTNVLTPRHWFQFGDDTAFATATQEDSQALLNVFSKWCQQAKFFYLYKCFRIKKNGKQSSQFKPYLKVNNEIIPAVKLNDSFVYLGKEFSFDMSNENVKNDLVKRLSDYLEKIDILSLHPKHKINIVTKFVYSKLRWDLTIYHLSETWIAENLDN